MSDEKTYSRDAIGWLLLKAASTQDYEKLTEVFEKFFGDDITRDKAAILAEMFLKNVGDV